ncbi:MAG: O-antigen ligase family protein [Pseudomonadota bacterium]
MATALFVYCFMCVIFGGAGREGFVAHSYLQAVAALGVAVLVVTWPSDEPLNGLRIPIALLVACISLCLIQLIPLPANIWQQLPSRDIVSDGFRDLGLELPPLPLSLDPDATLATIGYAFTPLFILLLSIRVGASVLVQIVPALICTLAVVSFVLGISQLLSDQDLYLYAFTSRDLPVGFFSNINHQASLLLMTIPFAFYLCIKLTSRARTNDRRGAFFILSALLVAGLVVGVLIAQSIAGYVMLLPITLLSAFAFQKSNIKPKLAVSSLIGLTSLLAFLMSGVSSVTLDGADIAFAQSEVSRYSIWRMTVEAISEHWLLGAGVGTYESVIPLYENPNAVGGTWIARAHNDYLQVLMEAGLPGAVMIVLALYWFATASLRAWRRGASRGFPQFRRVATVALVVWAMHSLVDYPGRTIALTAVISLCVAALGVTGTVKAAKVPQESNRRPQNPKRFVLPPISQSALN